MSYRTISQVGGSNTQFASDNPLSYCIGNSTGQLFLHGSSASGIAGQDSKPCQSFLSDYCADNWDEFCEIASLNTSIGRPNNLQNYNEYIPNNELTSGDILLRNTASKKYLVSMGNCEEELKPFDPLVAASPMVSYWVEGASGQCVPIYSVDAANIDNDIVMNKILVKPVIAIDILINIYNSMKRSGTLKQLSGSRLGNFYENLPYFRSKGGLN